MNQIPEINQFIFDFDDTLADSRERIVELYNEDFQYAKGFVPMNPSCTNTYSFDELKCAPKGYVIEYFSQPRFFEGLAIKRGAISLITTLQNCGYSVFVASFGTQANLTLKKQFIDKYFKGVKFLPILLSDYPDKSHIDMSHAVFIDDVSKYLSNTNAAIKILMGNTIKPWNADWRGTRVNDIIELSLVLEQLGLFKNKQTK